MQIREIEASETPKLLPCLVQLSAHHNQISLHFKGTYPSSPFDDTIRIFAEALQRQASHIAVIEDGEQIVGFCKVDTATSHGKLDYLVVLREYRRKGLGQQLMDWAMAAFRERHIEHIEVKVVAGNDALHLYEKYGFKMNAYLLCRQQS